ncbi:MAG TPA: DUF4389 domain-containing protein [Mycobacterium sp.]|jgi:hypothetical protein
MLPQSADYPVRVRGDLDPALSRWQWLFKWILAIPHYIVLFFLHIAVVVVFVIAFFAILITGKYPRALFDFSVGVERWRWRVAFYALTVVGTDKYPPFSLQPKPDYPADLTVDYPEHLSRGLVLIKWWLLAIPQYVMILAFFTAGGVQIQLHPGEWISVPLLSLVSLLLTFAVVALVLTGRYPKGLYDFVLGLNRWAIRVRVYAALLRDEYPPFRLDLGPREPQHAVSPTSPEPQDI